MAFVSTKTYGHEKGYTVSYRQWRADTHCNRLHGYALAFYLEFEADDLDARNWVVDFGGLRTFREQLDDWFDHTCLVAQDDPEFEVFEGLHAKKMIKMVVVERTGCEGLAKFLFDYLDQEWLVTNGYNERVRIRKVQVSETPANSAFYERDSK
jgi:6-pyruvoyltetrahydropterin/6-carboxytetrahydropterin synthase